MKATITFAAAIAVLAASSTAIAQEYGTYYSYDHRSTALGDWYAGASELVRAEGAYLRDEAAAAQIWLDVDRGREAFRYEMAEWRQQVELQRQQSIKDRAEARRTRQAQAEQARDLSARELLQDLNDGMPVWPAALRRPEFAGSLSMIESLLRNWDAAGAPTGDAFRAALATELGVLETRITDDTSIAFLDRVNAVKTLRLLMELTDANVDAASLAMR